MSFLLDSVPKILITEIRIEDDSISYLGIFDKVPIIKTNWLAYIIDGSISIKVAP